MDPEKTSLGQFVKCSTSIRNLKDIRFTLIGKNTTQYIFITTKMSDAIGARQSIWPNCPMYVDITKTKNVVSSFPNKSKKINSNMSIITFRIL